MSYRRITWRQQANSEAAPWRDAKELSQIGLMLHRTIMDSSTAAVLFVHWLEPYFVATGNEFA